MEKEVRYRIHLQNEDTGTIISKDFSFNAIFIGAALDYIQSYFKRYFIIGKSEFTGRFDCNGNKIYENDIIEFDANEWGDDKTNIHIVAWDNEKSEWSFGGGTASDMNFRTVIGNRFDNPNIWNKLKDIESKPEISHDVRSWNELQLLDDIANGKCSICKSVERRIKGRHEYCGGCGTLTWYNKYEE
jgi:hypothetical protein